MLKYTYTKYNRGTFYQNANGTARYKIDGLVQEWRNSSALAMELRLSCTNPSILHIICVIVLTVNQLATWNIDLSYHGIWGVNYSLNKGARWNYGDLTKFPDGSNAFY